MFGFSRRQRARQQRHDQRDQRSFWMIHPIQGLLRLSRPPICRMGLCLRQLGMERDRKRFHDTCSLLLFVVVKPKNLGCVTIYCVGRANSLGIGIRHASFEGRSPSFLLLPWAYQSSYIQRHQKIVLFVSKELLLGDMGFPKVKLGDIQWFGI